MSELKEKSLCGISTPSIVLPSYYGHLLYTPIDLEKDVIHGKVFTQLYVGDLLQKDFKEKSIFELSTVNKDLVQIFSYWGTEGPPVNCEAQTLNINTSAGRKKVTNQDYISRIMIEKPPIIVSLADEIFVSVGNNRTKKAVNRSWSWFKELREKDLGYSPLIFGVLVADFNHNQQVKNMIESLITAGANGIIIGGAHPHMSFEQRKSIIQEIRNQNSEIFIAVQGADSFQQILEDLELGIDLIYSNYPLLLTKRGCAINVIESTKVEAQQEHEEIEDLVGKRKRENDEPACSSKTSKRAKRSRHDQEAKDKDKNNEEDEKEDQTIDYQAKAVPFDSYSINLWDEKFMKDKSPLLGGCDCHACRHHTKAYIHHLLKSNELTADVLLYQHNQYQLLRILEEARKAISEGSFALWKAKFEKELN